MSALVQPPPSPCGHNKSRPLVVAKVPNALRHVIAAHSGPDRMKYKGVTRGWAQGAFKMLFQIFRLNFS